MSAPERLLARESSTATAGEDLEAFVEALREIRDAQDIHPSGGEFNGKRNAIEAAAYLGHDGALSSVRTKLVSARAAHRSVEARNGAVLERLLCRASEPGISGTARDDKTVDDLAS